MANIKCCFCKKIMPETTWYALCSCGIQYSKLSDYYFGCCDDNQLYSNSLDPLQFQFKNICQFYLYKDRVCFYDQGKKIFEIKIEISKLEELFSLVKRISKNKKYSLI